MDIIQRTICSERGNVIDNKVSVGSMQSGYASTSKESFLRFFDETFGANDHMETRLENPGYLPTIGHDSLVRALDVIDREKDLLQLIDIFFAVCETNHYYVNYQKFTTKLQVFLEQYNKWPIQKITQDWKFIVVLLGMLAVASGYEYLVKENTISDVPSSVLGLEDPGMKYYKACIPFIGDLIACHDIESAQGLLLLGIFLTSIETSVSDSISFNIGPSDESGYIYIRMATEIALANKAHLILVVHSPEDEANLRFWWSCYCLERRYGINIGKPSLIDKEEITSQLPSDCPELRNKKGASNYLHQRAMIELTYIMDQISLMLSGSPSLNSKDRFIQLDFDDIKGLVRSLDEWKTSFPSIFDVDELDAKDNLYRAHIHLRLYYLLAKVYLGKPFLLLKVELQSGKKNLNNNERVFIDHLASIGVDSAFRMVQLLESLKENRKLGLFSSTDLNFCNASLFIIAVFLKIDKSESSMLFLKKGIEVLQALAMGCTAAKGAFRRFNKIQSHILKSLKDLGMTATSLVEYNGSDLLENVDTEGDLIFDNDTAEFLNLPRSIIELESLTFDEEFYCSQDIIFE